MTPLLLFEFEDTVISLFNPKALDTTSLRGEEVAAATAATALGRKRISTSRGEELEKN